MVRSLFLTDLPTKLMALGMGIIVWIFLDHLDREQAQEASVTEEARLIVLPTSKVAVLRVTAPDDTERLDGPNGRPIRVTLRGLKGVLNTAVRGLECRHPLGLIEALPENETKTLVSVLRASDFDLPRGIEVTSISPPEVRVEVALETIRPLRIDDNASECLTGPAPPGLQVERISFSPTHVSVRGLRHILNRLNTIPIVPVDVQGLVPPELGEQGGTFSQHVQIRDAIQGTPVTTNEAIVMTAVLRPVDAVRTIPDARAELWFPDGFPHPRDRVRVAGPAAVGVRLKGAARMVDALAAGRKVRVLADLGRADLSNPRRIVCPLRAFVDAPEGAPPVQVTLDPAQVILEIAP